MTSAERLLLHASALAAAATGVVYFWMKHLMRSDDPFSVVNHPWQPHVLALHVLAVPWLVFALGLITREHIIGRFLDHRPRRGRASGAAAVLPGAAMIATGYLAQVVTGAEARKVLGLSHAACGALFALLYLVHLAAARTGHRAANGERGAAETAGPGAAPPGLLRRLDRLGRRVIESSARSRAVAPAARPRGRTP